MTGRRNPEALHEAAAGWREMGGHLDGMVRELDKHVARAAAADWQGPAGEAFAADWHRLKRSVDDSLPVFELAAADLDSAASRPAAPEHDGEAKDAPAPAAPAGNSPDSSRDLMYGVMALGQLGNALGGFARGKKGGGGGGQGNRPPLKGEWAVSDAPSGPDPFGPGGARRGGAGVAKGARTPEGAAASGTGGAKNAAPADKGSGGAAPKGAATGPAPAAPGGPAPAAPGGPAPAAAPDAKGSGAAAPSAGADTSGGVRPDVGRHGAFG